MLQTLPTPSLLLDEARMLRNIERLRSRIDGLGVQLRPHLKTAKSVEVARRSVELAEQLGLREHLERAHLPKFGLRLFQSTSGHDLHQAVAMFGQRQGAQGDAPASLPPA